MRYQMVKRYGHEEGWSCAFRQWRADHSHCKFIHGYALGIELTFGADELDEHCWVLDFGALRPVKAWLQDTFDHKMVVASDDPLLGELLALRAAGLADVTEVDDVGCEKFAEMVYEYVASFLNREGHYPRVHLISVRVSEHGGNHAVFAPGS